MLLGFVPQWSSTTSTCIVLLLLAGAGGPAFSRGESLPVDSQRQALSSNGTVIRRLPVPVDRAPTNAFHPGHPFAEPVRAEPATRTEVPGSLPVAAEEPIPTTVTPNATAPTKAPAPTPAGDYAAMQRQIDVQQQQLQTLHDMIRLTADELQQLESSPAGSAAPADYETDMAEMQSRQRQAARRDTELATHLDMVTESFDSYRRESHPSSTGREWYLPSRFNESPIVHYGQLAFTYADFEDKDGNFASPVYFPRFLMMLHEQLVLDVNLFIKSDSIQVVSAAIDWHVHDNLSLSAGRFYSPFGFFGERLQTGWVWKSVDIPLMFNQIHPTPSSMNGIMARGAFYPGMAPVKIEYAAYLANGLSLKLPNGNQKEFADLNASRNVFDDVNNEKAFGGRVGVSFPERGVILGASGLLNGAYDPEGEHDLNMWGVDFSFHRGNWDFRYEFIQVDQQSPFGPIDRDGMYAQIAYRDHESLHPLLQRLEYVFRFGSVDFDGIDLAATGLDFGGREKQPVDRDRWLAQVNFYPYPSLNLKLGYEFLNERNIDELDDNGIVAQILWGF